VIVNEFGRVGIDGRLVVGADEEAVELSNGCLCCTVRGDLARTVGSLLERRTRKRVGRLDFDRILIEASGLASPGPVAQTLEIVPELREGAVLDGIVTLARADSILAELEEFPEAAEQVGYADRLVLNACDLVDEAELGGIEAALRARNALAPIRRAVRAEVPVDELLAIGTGRSDRWELPDGGGAPEGVHVHGEGHDRRVTTVSLSAERPLDIHRLKIWLQFLAADRTHEILRLKGIVACQGIERGVVVQGVHQWLELGPGETERPERSSLVLIGRDLAEERLRRGWSAVRA
jgi:G3E family GTPase